MVQQISRQVNFVLVLLGVEIEKYYFVFTSYYVFVLCSRYKTCEEMRQQERELLTTNENCDSQEAKDSQTRTRCH